MVQVQLAHQRVMVPEAAFQRLRQVADLGAHDAPGQLGEHLAAALPIDQRPDHRQPRNRVNTGGHRVQLDPGVLEHPTQPLGLRRPLLDDFAPVADHITDRLDLRRGDEAAFQQPALQQLSQPGGIDRVGLAARHVLDMRRVAHQHLRERARL